MPDPRYKPPSRPTGYTPPVKAGKGARIGADRAGGATPGATLDSGTKGQPERATDLTKLGSAERAYRDHGEDFFSPGQAAGQYAANQGAYNTPGQGETVSGAVASDLQRGSQGESAGQDYWQGVNGHYAAGGPGYVKDAHSQFDKNVGGPGLDAYYDRAFEQGSRRLDRASAARGQFGSSEAMRGQRDLSSSLGAEQANREADYNLRRQQQLTQSAQAASGDELGWTQGLGGLAFQAGQEKLSYGMGAANVAAQAQGLEQDRIASGYNAAMGIDQYDLANRSAGMGAANVAQGAREGRLQGMFDNQITVGDRVAGYYGDAISRDAEYAAQQVGTGQGATVDAQNRADTAAQQNQTRFDAVVNQASQFAQNNPWSGQNGGGKTGGTKTGANKKAP